MRKTAPLLLIVLSLFSLPAQQQVVSNSIGQDRGRFAQKGEYILLFEDDEAFLFHEGEAVWKKSKKLTKGGVELSTYWYDSDELYFKQYENNRLIAEGQEDTMRYFYYDENGLMTKSTLLVSGLLTEMELYSYDEGTKGLASILTITEEGSVIAYYGNPSSQSWFSFTEDDLFTKVTQLSPSLQIEEKWQGDTRLNAVTVEIPKEGGMRLITTTKEGEVSELYDGAGLLVERHTPYLRAEYWYNEERALIEVREYSLDAQERIIRYEEGRTVSESLYQEGVLEKETLYPEETGKVETLYDKGEPYCDIFYALDGERVLSIRYR